MGIFTGSTASDYIVGGYDNDILRGGDGNDTLAGGDGNDTLYGEAGDDFLFGLQGNDYIDGGAGNDSVLAGFYGAVSINLNTGRSAGAEGIDTLVGIENAAGDAYDDTLTGSIGANRLAGLGGNDALYGLAGNDSLYGGAGNDWIDGGSGNDAVFYDEATGAVAVNLATGVVTGALGNDTLVACEIAFGGAYNDTLVGSAGANTLSGGAGNDVLDGGDGNDSLVGGAGSDTLTGGAGIDRFVFDNTSGVDVVTDFLHATDKVTVNAALFGIGDSDAVIDSWGSRAVTGGFTVTNELVVISKDIAGAITTGSAATVIGSATVAYAVGDTRLFVVDNGADSGVFLFHSANADAVVSAGELTQIATLTGVTGTTLTDYAFIV